MKRRKKTVVKTGRLFSTITINTKQPETAIIVQNQTESAAADGEDDVLCFQIEYLFKITTHFFNALTFAVSILLWQKLELT